MCWSGEASFVLATIGLSTTAYAAYKKESPALYLTLGYFSLMELLQGFTYMFIGQCGHPWNQILTLFGLLHISFQPFFINALSLYFVPTEVRKRIQFPVYFLCFIASVFMLIQIYPFDWAGSCTIGRSMCGETLCSVMGNWHIAWEIPYNGLTNFVHEYTGFKGFFSYVIVGFILPLLYGSWRMTAYHLIMGPTIANILTDNVNEMPAVWCLLSIGFLLIVVKTPIRKYLHVQKWFWWPKSWRN